MKHLEQLAPDVYAMLQRADGSHLRMICLRVCEYAVSYNRIVDLAVDESLNCLRLGVDYPKNLSERLDAIVNDFDDRYFELKDRVDEAENDEDCAQLTVQYREHFRKARAVAALQFSANQNSFDAVTDAIYEASASVPDKELIFSLVRKLLRS
ncbi:hypothetical protein [Burkholderia territorii]|uniref:hypothetical protein n=1 Tax=Burkholderia territorii TaxID=1503055 RepID=UPI0012DA556F|nr:hypothetical protein [Burkholderia territorii]